VADPSLCFISTVSTRLGCLELQASLQACEGQYLCTVCSVMVSSVLCLVTVLIRTAFVSRVNRSNSC
jgi:hypothetical protein